MFRRTGPCARFSASDILHAKIEGRRANGAQNALQSKVAEVGVRSNARCL